MSAGELGSVQMLSRRGTKPSELARQAALRRSDPLFLLLLPLLLPLLLR